jgi:hypothetical protein
MADSMLMRSGLPSLALEISEFMQNGPVSDRVNKVSAVCSTTARNMQAGLHHSLSVLDAIRMDREQLHGDAGSTAGAAAAKLERLDAIRGLIESTVTSYVAELDKIKQQSLASLNDGLQKLLSAFAVEETGRFSVHLLSNSLHEWRCHTMQLRLQFEKELVQNFNRAFAQIGETRMKLEKEIAALTRRAATEADLPVEAGASLVFKNYPAVTALSDRVTFDDSNQLLSEWWRRAVTPESRIKEFDSILRADFTAVASKLVRASDVELTAIVSSIARHYRVFVTTVALSQGRGLELISRHQLVASHTDDHGGDAYRREIEIKTLETQARLTSITGIMSGFLQQSY